MRIVNGVIYIIIFTAFFVWVTERRKEKEDSYLCRYIKEHMQILMLLFIANTISFGLTFQKADNTYIAKDGYNGEEKQVGFVLEKEDKQEEITLTVHPRKLTKEEEKEKMKEAFSYLKKHLKGENKSLSEVKKPLDFSLDYEKYPFDIEFQPKDYSLIDGEGTVKNEKAYLLSEGYSEGELKKGISSSITVLLWYGEDSKQKTFEVRVFPREEKISEEYFAKVINLFEKKEKESLYQEGFSLPLEAYGVSIKRLGDNAPSPMMVLMLGIILGGLLILKEKEEKKQEEGKKQELLLRAYPWFVNELVLLLGAGMQVKNILQVLLKEYQVEQERNVNAGKKRKRKEVSDYREPLMKELAAAKNSLDFGMSEEQVYYQLGRRLKLSCYIKIMTLLEQNVKKGAKGLTETFEQEELAALEERKNIAKRYGEKAGTKLLGR